MSQSKAKKKRMHLKRTKGKKMLKSIVNLPLLVHMNVSQRQGKKP